MPFDVRALEAAYRTVIKAVIEEFGFKCLRIDEVQDAEPITNQILETIARHEVVLCDLPDTARIGTTNRLTQDLRTNTDLDDQARPEARL
jgi:hypothetical protein